MKCVKCGVVLTTKNEKYWLKRKTRWIIYNIVSNYAGIEVFVEFIARTPEELNQLARSRNKY